MAEEIEELDSEDEEDLKEANLEDRDKDYSEIKSVRKQLEELYPMIIKGFEDKRNLNEMVKESWDVYNCELDSNQAYIGRTAVYVPIVHDAIEARVTRFTNALFPQTGHYIDMVGNGEYVPYEEMALMNHYVITTNLKDKVVPALFRTGDVTGQYLLMPEWVKRTRNVVKKVTRKAETTELGTDIEGSEDIEDVEFEEIEEGSPDVTVLDPRDVLVLPATVDEVEDADVVVIICRYSKDKIEKMLRDKIFAKGDTEEFLKNMSAAGGEQQPNTQKEAADAAGVKMDSKKNKTGLIYQVWTKLKIRGERRMCVSWFAGADLILGCKRNPYWNDRVPLLSQPAMKVPGSHFGKSRVEFVKGAQYAANDAVNMGFDSAQYALLPIVMTDPEKNPRVGSMVLAMAAIWETNPNDTQIVTMPQLWKDAFTIVSSCKEQIMQSLSVNPSMIAHGQGSKKPSQAEVAQEQQVALQSTADVVNIVESGILSKLARWFYELDYQFRTKPVTIRKYGMLGIQAEMQQVPPIQTDSSYEFRWYGTEGMRSAQQIQQGISFMNVLLKMPPQQLNGRKVDVGPILDSMTATIYGPRIAPHVLIDQRHQLSMPPEQENVLIVDGFPVQAHPMDDDMHHIQVHLEEMKAKGDPTGYFRGHLLEHMKQAKEKAMAAQPQGGQPVQGGGGPRMGAQPQPPTGAQQPPGAIHPDQMQDPGMMPRKA